MKFIEQSPFSSSILCELGEHDLEIYLISGDDYDRNDSETTTEYATTPKGQDIK